MTDSQDGRLFLGAVVDPASHDRTEEQIRLKSSDFTTHGVIVGMTGSGKTGLGVVLLEEALAQGIPCLVIDPKGDMGNLLLNFPDLDAESFAPWVQPDQDAEQIAAMWRSGLESWGIGAAEMQALKDAADFTIYTPGSSAGTPLNVIGSLKAPDTDDPEILADEVSGFASSLLGLVGIDADPLTSREHILISNLLHHAWAKGQDLDLPGLLGMVQSPPMRRLGVIELDTFYPPKDRMELLMRLNGLLASPTFAAWGQGVPLDIQQMLFGNQEKPAAAVVSIAHLSEEERQFVVTLVLSKLVTWMRQQGGSSELRVLVYMDEVYGYAPPTATPPSKRPILTLLKQARAFGVGLVLSTQNPVDLDYKAISNAGTWMIGRLQTERDRDRLLDGMRNAAGETDITALGSTIAGLAKREFVLHRTRASTPSVFTTRWAMSYLAGPLARNQIAELTKADPPVLTADEGSTREPASTATEVEGELPREQASSSESADLLADETTLLPDVHDSVPVFFLDPAARWADDIGADFESSSYEAAIVARYQMLFDETAAKLRHTVEWEGVVHPLTESSGALNVQTIDYDDRDLIGEVPTGARYVLNDVPMASIRWTQRIRRDLVAHLHGSESMTLFRNASLKLWSIPDESEEAFGKRCSVVADDGMDDALDKLRRRLLKKLDAARQAVAKVEQKASEHRADLANSQADAVAGIAGSVLGGLLSGKGSGRDLARKATAAQKRATRASKLLSDAQTRVREKTDKLLAVEDEAREAISELNERWDDKAADIEERVVGLEKSDITLVEMRLVWVPKSR